MLQTIDDFRHIFISVLGIKLNPYDFANYRDINYRIDNQGDMQLKIYIYQ